MSIHADIWALLPHGLVGLVLGWSAVLVSRNGLRFGQRCFLAAACLISCVAMSAVFTGPWWAAPGGLISGTGIHAAFLSSLQSHRSNR